MDALELDLVERKEGEVVDLEDGRIDRELKKAFTAFSSCRSGEKYSKVCTGLWGCGAFGGDKQIKAIIQWCAASYSGAPLSYVLAAPATDPSAIALVDFVTKVRDKRVSARDLERLLRKLDTTTMVDSRSAFQSILKMLDQRILDQTGGHYSSLLGICSEDAGKVSKP